MVSATDPCADSSTPRAAATILEHIGEAFVSVDAQWRFTYVNAQAERIYKKSREHFLGNNVWQMFPTALGTEFERVYRRAMAERIEATVDGPFPRLSGWFEVKVYPLDNGGLAFYFSDISQRRRAEKHLDCQRRVHELLLAAAPLEDILATLANTMESVSIQPVLASILIADSDTGRLRLAAAPSLPDAFNRAFDDIHGFEPSSAEDIADHPSLKFRELALLHGLRATWSTPIVSTQGAVLGSFALYYRDSARPAPAEEELASVLANTAAMIIAHHRSQNSLAAWSAPQSIDSHRLELASGT